MLRLRRCILYQIAYIDYGMVGSFRAPFEFLQPYSVIHGGDMSLSLEDLKGELRENYLRTEDVLTGMDAYIVQLEKRLANVEGKMRLLEAAIYAEDEPESAPPMVIVSR